MPGAGGRVQGTGCRVQGAGIHRVLKCWERSILLLRFFRTRQTEVRMDLLPAVLVGGPPHSGKSVLAYALSRALRERGVAHYLLRACPDGEGDWSQEAEQSLVRQIRIKGSYTPA